MCFYLICVVKNSFQSINSNTKKLSGLSYLNATAARSLACCHIVCSILPGMPPGGGAGVASETNPVITMGFDGSHIEIVLKLCKNNGFHYNDVWVVLKKTLPPRSDGVVFPPEVREVLERGMRLHQQSMDAWTMDGLLAIDASVTKKNPTGKDKVAGFVLYLNNNHNNNQLQILFLLVDKRHRRKGHASKMMREIQARHLGDAQSGERLFKVPGNPLLLSAGGYPLVNYITVEVVKEDNDQVIAFYRTLGFVVASEVAGWCIKVGLPTHTGLMIMVDAGPQTFASVRDDGI
jgi:ribosomal protein S18 acetylase RimI-like enzyme